MRGRSFICRKSSQSVHEANEINERCENIRCGSLGMRAGPKSRIDETLSLYYDVNRKSMRRCEATPAHILYICFGSEKGGAERI